MYFQGCVDEYEKCPQWSRAGHCRANSDFMFFHCRESCGACGFKSRKFKVLKIISKKLKINTYIYLSNINLKFQHRMKSYRQWVENNILMYQHLITVSLIFSLMTRQYGTFFPISEFSYFVIRFLNHVFFVINFSYFIIRFQYRALK